MKKKGFTLIELLAVIVILAIIALIATPIILSMINNARKSAAKSSAYGYFESIDSNNGFADAEIVGYTKIIDGTHDVSEISVPMKGKEPDSGSVEIEKGKVKTANICINGYTVTYNGHEAEVGNKCNSEQSDDQEQSKTYTVYSAGDIVQYDPVNNESCISFNIDNIKNGTSTCYKWRVIITDDDSSKNNITIQMDHNLINKSTWSPANTSSGPTTALSTLATETSSWNNSLLLNYTYDTSAATNNYGILTCENGSCSITGGASPIVTGLHARMITGEEITNITKTKALSLTWSLSNSSYYYFSNTNKNIGTNNSGTGNTDLSWLLENTTLNTNSGATANTYGDNNSGYWTLSPNPGNNTRAFRVYVNGGLGTDDGQFNNSQYYRVSSSKYVGIRPVITISKSVIE